MPDDRPVLDRRAGGDRPMLPLPGDPMPTQRWTETVIASVWLDDTRVPVTALVITIVSWPPYYRVRDLVWARTAWRTAHVTEHVNIVPAVAEYEQRGGDY